MPYDFLIIGQGLAGSILAWELCQRGASVIVADTGEDNASKASAGIVNPITGMRLVKTEQAELLLPAAKTYYAKLSAFFRQTFYVEKPMLRIFNNAAELSQCRKRLAQESYQPYLGELNLNSQELAGFHAPLGFIEQKQCGHLLTFAMLTCLKQWLLDHDRLRLTKLNYRDIKVNQQVHWHDLSASRVIFCEGHYGSRNPWFNWLPFQPAKGEILTLTTLLTLPSSIFNYGHWLLPLTANTARVGATFEWSFADALPTQKGKNDLLSKLNGLAPKLADAEISGHVAGIRPGTEDKNPFIGSHPKHPKLGIFNGFGSKGSLQIPWYAQRFADHLVNLSPLPANCDIQRYQNLYTAG